MTQEEKAKAYDEALALMKDCAPDKDGYICVRPCDIFPELKESEDEKIRKAILDYLTIMWGNSQDDVCGIHVEDAISWLEKQKPINPTLKEKDRMDDAFTKMMLKESKQKPDKWSKEDEEHLKSLDDILLNDRNIGGKVYRKFAMWLQSLKQRMGGEQ